MKLVSQPIQGTLLLVSLLGCIFLTSCAPIITKHRMAISNETIPCPDSIRTTCLLVKIDTMESWTPWPAAKEIHGFEYQLGFSYDLAVEEVQKRNKKTPPWWRLVEVMSKEEFIPTKPRIYNTKWILSAYGMPEDQQEPIPGTEISLNFSDYGSISGKAACNRYFAEAGFMGLDGIKVTNPGSTRMACLSPEGIMELEHEYLELLAMARKYEVDREILTIYCEQGELLVFQQILE